MKACTAFAIVAAVALGGCSSWWSSDSAGRDRPRYPPGATVYKCNDGKQLAVRYLDGGKSAMMIYPDREFRLDRESSASGARYTNGRTTLSTKGTDATVEEGGQTLFAECHTATP